MSSYVAEPLNGSQPFLEVGRAYIPYVTIKKNIFTQQENSPAQKLFN